MVEIPREPISLGRGISVFSLEQWMLIFPWNLLRSPKLHLYSTHRNPFLCEVRMYFMKQLSQGGGKEQNVTRPPLNPILIPISPATWLQAPLLVQRWRRRDVDESLHSGHSSGALLGLLPGSPSVSHSVGCSHHPFPMPERIPLCEDESAESAKV